MFYGQGLHYINMQVNRTTKYDIRIIKIHLNKIKKGGIQDEFILQKYKG